MAETIAPDFPAAARDLVDRYWTSNDEAADALTKALRSAYADGLCAGAEHTCDIVEAHHGCRHVVREQLRQLAGRVREGQ